MNFIKKLKRLELKNASGVILHRCDYDVSCYSDNLFDQYGVKLEFDHVEKAVIKRKAEFLAGRYCAHIGLQKLGVNTTKLPIGKHRNPLWPDGITGSISHSGYSAFAALTQSKYIPHIGIDYEQVMQPDLARKLMHSIICDEEKIFLESIPLDFSFLLTLIFSAKESLFKTLYPLVNYYFDFSAARVVALDLSGQSFTLRLTEHLGKVLKRDQEFSGYFEHDDERILTYICFQP